MPLKLKKRGNGRELRRSTGTADKAIAQRIAAEAWKRRLDGPGARLTMA